MKELPLVSVIVLNYNGVRYLGELLRECLDSVLRTSYPHFEVVFVDNGSIDESLDMVEKNYGSAIRTVKNKRNLGFSEGFNTGIRASKGKYLALLSNDMTVDADWLNSIVRLMEQEPNIGIAGPKRLVYGKAGLLDGIGGDMYLCHRVRPVGTYEIDRGQFDTIIEDLAFVGGVMIIKREALKKVGLFDPDFFIFAEDVDLCFRVRKQGYKVVYVPEAVIYHKAHGTLVGKDPRGDYLEYMYHRSRVRSCLIHFKLVRLMSTFLIDSVWIFMANPKSKLLLLQAYAWNLRTINGTLKKRVFYGPSPPYSCKYPVISFRFSDLTRRMREMAHRKQQ